MSALTDKLNGKMTEKLRSALERAGLGGVVILLGDGNYSWLTQFPSWTGLITGVDGIARFDSDDMGKLRRAVAVLETLCRATQELNRHYTDLLHQMRTQLARQSLRAVEKPRSQ